MAAITIGLMDDHPAVLESVRSALESPGTEVCWSCGHVSELEQQLEMCIPQVLVLDIITPDVSGIEVFEQVAAAYPEIRIIAYSSLGSPTLIQNLIEVGVRGYVNKRQPLEDLKAAVETVAGGEISLPVAYQRLQSRFRIPEKNALSEREKDIMQMIADEFTSKEIADKLSISVNTVENHRKNIFGKLKAKNLAGAIVEAVRQGYISSH